MLVCAALTSCRHSTRDRDPELEGNELRLRKTGFRSLYWFKRRPYFVILMFSLGSNATWNFSVTCPLSHHKITNVKAAGFD